LDSEQNMLETVIEVLNELSKDEVKVYFCIGKKDVCGSRTKWKVLFDFCECRDTLRSYRLISTRDT
jgi:hypothetical protein